MEVAHRLRLRSDQTASAIEVHMSDGPSTVILLALFGIIMILMAISIAVQIGHILGLL